jgi:predicted site-specific integrase-resolvase
MLEPKFKYYKTQEIADLLQVSRKQVGRWRQTGLIKMTKAGHGYVCREEELVRFLESIDGEDVSGTADMAALAQRLKKGRKPSKVERRMMA